MFQKMSLFIHVCSMSEELNTILEQIISLKKSLFNIWALHNHKYS